MTSFTKSLYCLTFLLGIELSVCQVSNDVQLPKGFVHGEDCKRSCNGKPMKCYFNFRVENIYSMSKACFQCPDVAEDCFRPDCIVAGGIRRTLTVVNRQLPGPSIEVCQGDRIMVLVENHLESGESTAIHWHGQHLKKDPYMDGTPFVTQCPIVDNNNFTYEFTVNQIGTHFWHSHNKMQRGEGMFGPLIVHDEAPEHAQLYDDDLSEHIMMIGDWNDKNRMDVFQDYTMGGLKLIPTGMLINGLGYQSASGITETPLANFKVKRDKRYRFRLINIGFFDCPFEITVDNHTMTVIASDGQDVAPIEVTSIICSGGERYDFVIAADQLPSTYWIRVKGFVSCRHKQIVGVATLQYQDAPSSVPDSPVPNYDTAANASALVLNPISKKDAKTPVIAIDELQSLQPIDKKLKAEDVKRKFYLSFQMNHVDSPTIHRAPYYGYNQVPEDFQRATPQINHISHENLNIPLLPARWHINQKQFCSVETIEKMNCTRNYCKCPHVLEVKLGETVEMIFIEPNDQVELPVLHPIHLHGYAFYVLGWGEIGANVTREQVMEMDERGMLKRNLINPPVKDTVTVPKGGYVIVRFVADNPGFWLLHCHVEIHAEDGMQLVLKVGGRLQMPNAPKGFPSCGDYPNKGGLFLLK